MLFCSFCKLVCEVTWVIFTFSACLALLSATNNMEESPPCQDESEDEQCEDELSHAGSELGQQSGLSDAEPDADVEEEHAAACSAGARTIEDHVKM